ncbi:2-oxoglutarate dehydrogenase complex dihydrolipoyllysine-residue succinyltransferase [Stagnimonas aquatica]|uniref:Dihydrolipoyllysine-residue succinyltransferase component of 2-oxoglutarate dehydrogenase complex n=1 Tax=Stagnimonas aquatica TaxID=2689987 RepID=A0A3N0V9M1_9GAMM|nr:2-oxoglutarate dehydrogenase complex dihydrolipoyllysine-residue succinyltransferase [Stagnimonas aquatica]ROH89409.1 2-oxoglutarate dehydrogenase complex dihydrolipoyllysine-residue succinyltransferase [Stagnimonas aquatica]
MAIEIKVPNLPESVSSATVATWHVKAGDTVKREQNLVDLETDKVMLEVPATADGVLTEIRIQPGATVQAGDVIGILTEGAAAAAPAAPAAAAAAPVKAEAATSAASAEDVQGPAVRKLLAELGLSAEGIPASGRGGRLTVEDVKAYAASKPAAAPKAAAPAPAPVAAAPAAPRSEERVPMTRIRARIAERLKEAQNTAAMLTTFNEVDLSAVDAIRGKYKDQFEKTHGVKLGYMSFFVRAAVEALKKFPAVNASIDGGDIVYHNYYDIGIAVSSPRGLVVPILKDADLLGLAGVEKAIGVFGTKAKDNKLSLEDLTGGTFSITNGGVFGSLISTPILNPPQSAILGMHGINERLLDVELNADGTVKRLKKGKMMYLALSYDHRIIDGREAVLFLRTIKECLEDPARLLLNL